MIKIHSYPLLAVFLVTAFASSASAAVSGTDEESRGAGLRFAARDGRILDVRKLLESGVPVDSANAYGQTPLMAAALAGQASAMRLLLEAGAAPDRADSQENTALHFAAWNCGNGAVRLLLDRDVNVNLRNHNRTTALMNAAEQGCARVVRLLLGARGIDVRARNDWDKTARDYAAEGALVIGSDYGQILSALSPWFNTPRKAPVSIESRPLQ